MAKLGLDRRTTLGGNTEDVLAKAKLKTSGLTSEEARDRLEKLGPNIIAEDEKISILELILDQLKSPLIYILLIAAVVTFALQDYKDMAVILAVVFLNGIIGFTQEYKANVAIKALQQLTSSTTRVRRDGRVQRIDSADLVPGDIVLLQAGDRVDADCRLLSSKASLVRIAALCNNSHITMQDGEILEREGNPTELAILEMALAMNPKIYDSLVARESVAEVPFSSERKFMASLYPATEGGFEMLAKGSPEAIIARAQYEWTEDGYVPLDKELWLKTAEEMASRGQRVLALAHREWNSAGDGFCSDCVNGLSLIGLVGLIDPPRPDAAEAVKGCHSSGIRVVMITGDHAVTARAIAIELGILQDEGLLPPIEQDARVVTGRTLQDMSDEELILRLDDVRVFARVTPHDKHRLVRLLREQGKVVAVTGDGVNDAPALKTAHLGVAMGKSGTEVAKQASDMVLLDDSLAAIYEAVKEGRYVFENIKKVSFFLVSSGVGEVLAILAALSMAWPLPYTAVQILWINLVTNGLQDVALAFEPGEKQLANRKPRGLKEGIFDRTVIQHTIGIMFLFAIGTLALFHWAGKGDNLGEARTIAMTTMVMFQMWHVFNCRSMETSVFRIPFLSNRFLVLSVIAAFGAQLAVLYWGPAQSVFGTSALSLHQWMVILAVTAPVILLMEASKWIARRRHPQQA